MMYIVANIKILGIMLISQLIKGSKEKFFFIKPNFRRKYQTSSSGQKFFSKKFCRKRKMLQHYHE